jgi:hypothetical protein
MKNQSFISSRPMVAVLASLIWFCVSILLAEKLLAQKLPAQPSVSAALMSAEYSSCPVVQAMLDRADILADSLAVARSRSTVQQARIDSLVQIASVAHGLAIDCRLRLCGMMLKAASAAADKLRSAENVLIFRLGVRDVRSFLVEARRYYVLEE